MKISAAFRILNRAQAFAAPRSLIATAAKQRRNILQPLCVEPHQLIQAVRA